MNIKLEFDDEGNIYELMDILVLQHLKNSKAFLEIQKDENHGAAIVLDAINICIGYFGK